MTAAALQLSRSALPDPLPALLDRLGRRRSVSANAVIVLSGADGVWLVESGSFDVFAVERDAEGRPGLRHHLCAVPAPGLMAAFPARAGDGVDIVAVSREAAVAEVDGSQAAGVAAVAEALPAMARLLDGWIEGLAAGVARFFAVRSLPLTPLIAGAEAVPAEGTVLAPPRGVVWAYVADGDGRYMGLPEAAVATGSLLPLSAGSWLSPGAGLKVTGYRTEGVLKAPDWSRRLASFHRLAVDCLIHTIANLHIVEAARLQSRAIKAADTVDATLGRFVSLVTAYEPTAVVHDPDNAVAVACAIAARHLGVTIEDSPRLARRRTEDRPLSVEDVARVARLRVRQVALRDDWWRQDLGPLVAFAEEDGRALALVPVRNTGYVVHDPRRGGPARPLTADLAETIAPLAWAFYPPLPDGKVTALGLLLMGLKHQKRDLAVAMVAGALGSLVANILPVATAAVFATIIPGHHVSQLVQVGLALVIAAAATVIFKITGDVAMLRVEARLAGRLQAGVLDRLLRLPSSFFNTYSTGDLANRTLMVEAVRKALTGLVMSSFMAGVFSIFSLALLFYYQPMTALLACLLFVVMLAVAAFTGARQLAALYEGEALSGNIMSLVLQLISGIQKLRMAGAEDRAWVIWGKAFAELRTRAQRSRLIGNAYQVFMAGYDVLSLGAVFLVVTLAAGEDLETGQFLAFITAFTMFMSSMGQVSRALIQCFNVTPLIARARPLLEAIPEVDATKADPGPLAGDIEVNGVYFRYDRDSPRVLNGLTLAVKPGQFIALVGPSGCGKSTLMKLLLGFERPEAGGIFYDGLDLRTLDVQAVRRQIGVVLQSGRLMPGSIYENIKGASDATVDGAWEAARMAGLEDDVRAMPMGMHTVLTEGSASLSGGQIQRLLIARAVVSKPRIIFFDEATSALDNKTQAVVTESLSRLSVTRIAIAHRLSTVKDADRIYVVDEGRVAEAGTYDELMAKNGIFAQLARRQLT